MCFTVQRMTINISFDTLCVCRLQYVSSLKCSFFISSLQFVLLPLRPRHRRCLPCPRRPAHPRSRSRGKREVGRPWTRPWTRRRKRKSGCRWGLSGPASSCGSSAGCGPARASGPGKRKGLSIEICTLVKVHLHLPTITLKTAVE